MATVRGLFASDNFEAGIKKLDVRDKIFELQPEVSPFISMLGKLAKKRAVDTAIKWFEDDLLGNYTQINFGAGYADDVTQWIVDDASIFQVGDVAKLMSAVEECVLVTAVDDTGNTIDVVRGWGSTAAQAVTDGDYVYRLGSAMKEGYNVPDSLVTVKLPKTNYLQIFSKAVKITETAENVDTYGGNRRNFERMKKAVEMKREIESQLIWGEAKEDVSSSEPRRQTAGVYSFMGSTSPNLDMSSTAITESALEGFLKDLFLYDGGDRVLFCGPLILSQISQFASGKQRIDAGSTIVYGVKVRTYHSAMGDLHLALDRHFIGPHAGKGIALKMDELVYRFLQNSDFKLEMNMQNKESHYKLDEYNCTIGLEFHHALKHGHILGVA